MPKDKINLTPILDSALGIGEIDSEEKLEALLDYLDTPEGDAKLTKLVDGINSKLELTGE